mgnify:CR=1 FL=1
MITRDFTINNKLGLHARPSAQITQTASRYASEVWLAKNGRRVNAKSIMGVMMLAAGLGAELKLRADGSDEEAAMSALVDLFERKFDEGQ